MCNHAKQVQYGNEIDVSSIGHSQCYKPPTGRLQNLLVYNPH
ncbi:hypothetical protein SLEP1_g19013 [Rubroshorea leprosula]|nr:hypothetical protein SLEP1_g19013 [Rubroshorea leprosula]